MAKPAIDNGVTPNAEAPAVEAPAAALSREEQALALVNSYVPWSVGAGVLPFPGIDTLTLIGIQVRMLSKLAAHYDVPFKESSAKSIVGSLLGSVISTNLGAAAGSLLKFIPLVGTLASFAATPALFSAATYAIGRVFITHFEAGGTFLDFDPTKTRAYFQSEFESAKSKVEVAAPATPANAVSATKVA